MARSCAHDGDEDVHMAIERRATELAGPAGAKIHTAAAETTRSRRRLRLFTRDAVTSIASEILELVDALGEVGARYPSAYLPGYTHCSGATGPVDPSPGGARVVATARRGPPDRREGADERLAPGAGALAGTSLAIVPAFTAQALGFRETFANSMDAVSDRDFVAETLFDNRDGRHSSLAHGLKNWCCGRAANFISPRWVTTSRPVRRCCPEKNSDVAELARGKSGRLVAISRHCS